MNTLIKNAGVRPIGIGEELRRIIAKAVQQIVGKDIQSAVRPLQACTGHEAGCEATVHAMKTIYAQNDTNAILLMDATNTFNTIKRQAALHNVGFLCPSISCMLISTYRSPVKLFVIGGGAIKSTEGITQGDPMVMAMYAVTLLIKRLCEVEPDVKQTWFADRNSSRQITCPITMVASLTSDWSTDRTPPKCHQDTSCSETRTFR